MNIDAFMTRITADEGGIVDGVEHLTGPAMADLVKLWNQISGPCFQPLETNLCIIGFAGLVVGPADDDEIGFTVAWLNPHIMIGIEGIPIESVGQGAAPNPRCHGISPVWRHLGVERNGINDGRVGGDYRSRAGEATAISLDDYFATSFLYGLDGGTGAKQASLCLDGAGQPCQVFERVKGCLARIAQVCCSSHRASASTPTIR